MKEKEKIKLPEGHTWEEINVDATHHDFICECGAMFSVDLTDDSVEYDEGDGKHGKI